MATFPKITGPCPYRLPLSALLDAEGTCRLCRRQVHDLSAMTERARRDFLSACAEDTCVSYRLPVDVTALAIAAAVTAVPAAAQPAPAADPQFEASDSETSQDVFVGSFSRLDPGNPTITSLAHDPSARYGYKTLAQAARERWDETHRRLDSRKGRERAGD